MSEEKHNWFIYVEGESWGHPIGWGRVYENITLEEARKIAFKNLMGEFGDEGSLSGRADDLLYLMKEAASNPDAQKELEGDLEWLDERCQIIQIASIENLPALPVLEQLQKDTEEWKLQMEKQREEEERRTLQRLQNKYPDLKKS